MFRVTQASVLELQASVTQGAEIGPGYGSKGGRGETHVERHGNFCSIISRSRVSRLEIPQRINNGMHNGLHSSHPRSPTMQGQKCCLAPSGNSYQQVVSTGKQDGNTYVDQAEGTRSVPYVLAEFELWRWEPDIWRKIPEGDGTEDHVQDDKYGDENAECSPRYVTGVSRKRL